MADVAAMSFADRLGVVFDRCLPRLVPDVRNQFAQMVTPQSLSIIAGVLTAWVVLHAVGVGELVDVILSVGGVLSIGLSVFSGLDELWEFASRTYKARSDRDLDAASGHLAQAVAILGVQAVLAVLFKGAARGERPRLPSAPPRTPGSLRYRPTTVEDPALSPGVGSTDFLGNVRISSQGTNVDRALVLVHERIHQSLAPKFYPLRQIRIENRIRSYFQSSLWRFCEEALCETIAQVGVNGLRKGYVGIRFPISNGYVYLLKGGGYNAAMAGRGIVPEGAALLANGIVQGLAFQLWFKGGVVTDGAPRRLPLPGGSR